MLKRLNASVNVDAVEVRTKEQLEDPTLDGLIIPGGESTTMGIVAERTGVLEPLRNFVKIEKKPVWVGLVAAVLAHLTRQARSRQLAVSRPFLKLIFVFFLPFDAETTSFFPYTFGTTHFGDFLRFFGHFFQGTCAGLILLANQASHIKQGGQSLVGGLSVTVERNAFGSQIDSFAAPVPSPVIVDGVSNPFPAVFIRAPVIQSIDAEDVETLAKITHAYHAGEEVGDKVVAVRQGNIVGTAFHPELTSDDRWHLYFTEFVAKAVKESRSKQ